MAHPSELLKVVAEWEALHVAVDSLTPTPPSVVSRLEYLEQLLDVAENALQGVLPANDN